MKNIKILICDDDHDNLNILGLLLELEGYSVIKEIDSTKVIKKIYDDKPDILLVDIWMPIVCGDEIIRKLRSNSKYQELPIIAFSASYDIEKLALEAGANYYVSKPFDINKVTELVSKLLN